MGYYRNATYRDRSPEPTRFSISQDADVRQFGPGLLSVFDVDHSVDVTIATHARSHDPYFWADDDSIEPLSNPLEVHADDDSG